MSTDFSEVVIEKMRAKHQAARPELRWERLDMLDLDAEDASFDAVVDKVDQTEKKKLGKAPLWIRMTHSLPKVARAHNRQRRQTKEC